MMIKVAGHWELGWNTPIKEVELWNWPLREFEIRDWYMWPVSGIIPGERSKVTLHEKPTMEDILDDEGLKGLTRVYFEPYNPVQHPVKGIDLREFNHPKDVVYIFGSNHYNAVNKFKKDGDFVVQVPTIENAGILWPHQCLMACLYDRLVKGWEGN